MRRLLRPFTYWSDFWIEFKTWRIFRRVALEQAKKLEADNDLRVDWLGRIYGVINLPEEVVGAAPQVQEAYVLQKVTDYGKVMFEIGLADVAFPEISRIDGAAAYLMVLYPAYEALTFWKLIGNLITTTIYGIILYFLVRVFLKYQDYLTEFFSVTWQSVKSIL